MNDYCENAIICGKLYVLFEDSFRKYHSINKGWTAANKMSFSNIKNAINNFNEFYITQMMNIEFRENKFRHRRPNWVF